MTVLLVMVLSLSSGWLFWRNQKVFRYRQRLLDQTSAASKGDIDHLRPWAWRYEAFQSESYGQMALCFWRRLDSFYPDRNFLDPTATAPHGGTH